MKNKLCCQNCHQLWAFLPVTVMRKATESSSVSHTYSPVSSTVVIGIISRRWAPSTSSFKLGPSFTSRPSLNHRIGASSLEISQLSSSLSEAKCVSSNSDSLGEMILTGGSKEGWRQLKTSLSHFYDEQWLILTLPFTVSWKKTESPSVSQTYSPPSFTVPFRMLSLL